MIVIDTNVISEVMKSAPSPQVSRWLAALRRSVLFTTTITLAEVHYGLELVPPGKRRVLLERQIKSMFEETIAGRILAFDIEAAHAFADIAARCRKIGRRVGELDAQIAAIARCKGAAIATRNVRDFADCGVELINPWT